MQKPSKIDLRNPIEGLVFTDNELVWKNRTIRFDDITGLAFVATVTQHSVNGMKTSKSYEAGFRIRLKSGVTIEIDGRKRGVFGSKMTEKSFEGMQIANSILSQITFNQRVEPLEESLLKKSYFIHEEYQISKNGDIFKSGEKTASFDMGNFSISKEPFAIRLQPKQSGFGVWLKRQWKSDIIVIPLIWNQDCFIYMMKNFIGITFRNTHIPEKTVDREKVFHTAILRFGAALSAVDGSADPSELQQLKRFFNIDSKKIPDAARIYNDALSTNASLAELLGEIKSTFADAPEILEAFLSGMCTVALADDVLDPREIDLLKSAAVYLQLGVSGLTRAFLAAGFDFESFMDSAEENKQTKGRTRQSRSRVEIELEVLGLELGVDIGEIKKTYRILVRKYHPDRLRGMGMPDSEVNRAEALLKRINAAHDFLVVNF